MVNINRLTKHDVQKLEQLNDLFGEVFEDSENYHSNRPSESYLAEYLQSNDHIVLVVEDGDNVIGGLVAYVLSKFEQERKEVYVYDIAVANDAQRQGIGKMLMDEIRRTAKAEGAFVVYLQADEGDDAVHFYRALNPTEELATKNFDFNV